ncbi:MAG: heparinase II/III family protein [Clostridia bacterium]|nr:heparinase II/III family protein [Clostridia bacterium]
MLTQQLEKIKNNLPELYEPYPKSDDRGFWDNTPSSIKTAYISEAEEYLRGDFPILKATTFMEFHRTGNRSNYQRQYSIRRKALNVAILAELFENNGRFIDFMVDLIWMMCEETTWIIPAHNNIGGYKHIRFPLPDFDRPIIDLMSGDTGAAIATALYYFRDKFDEITPQISRRADYELDRRIIQEYRNHTDYWWMGFMGDRIEQLNNWNPWINSNILIVLLFSKTNIHDKYYILHKITESLDAYIKGYPEDGGCDEGPGYWGRAGASLFDCTEILHEYSKGGIDIYSEPKIKNMCDFIHRAHISDGYFVNFADAAPRAHFDPALTYRFGKQVKSESAMAFGKAVISGEFNRIQLGRFGLNRPLRELMVLEEIKAYKGEFKHRESVYLKDIEVAYLRAETKNGELYLAAKGGNNLENHNHNDVGSFMIFGHGEPMVVDAGSMDYTKKTFSPQRYEIWTNCSLWHNLPEINGARQICGREYMAENVSFYDKGSSSVFSLDIQKAYHPSAGATRWTRTFEMDRENEEINITESFLLNEETTDIRISLITNPRPVISGSRIMLESGDKKLMISVDEGLEASYEEIALDDDKIRKDWGHNLYRISLKAKAPVKEGKYITKFKLVNPGG